MVIGARADGTKEVLATMPGFRESTAAWTALFAGLRHRGLPVPKLLVADGAAGAWVAASDVWPEMKGQRCWNHKIVNVLDQLPRKLRGVVRLGGESGRNQEKQGSRYLNFRASLVTVHLRPRSSVMDRAAVSSTVCRGFESLQGHHSFMCWRKLSHRLSGWRVRDVRFTAAGCPIAAPARHRCGRWRPPRALRSRHVSPRRCESAAGRCRSDSTRQTQTVSRSLAAPA